MSFVERRKNYFESEIILLNFYEIPKRTALYKVVQYISDPHIQRIFFRAHPNKMIISEALVRDSRTRDTRRKGHVLTPCSASVNVRRKSRGNLSREKWPASVKLGMPRTVTFDLYSRRVTRPLSALHVEAIARAPLPLPLTLPDDPFVSPRYGNFRRSRGHRRVGTSPRARDYSARRRERVDECPRDRHRARN